MIRPVGGKSRPLGGQSSCINSRHYYKHIKFTKNLHGKFTDYKNVQVDLQFQ